MFDQIYHWLGFGLFWIGAFCGVSSISFMGIGQTIKYFGMWDTFVATSKYVWAQKKRGDFK